ncbi:hypothetical protein TNCV_4983581 [Trichonephila clavipes]|nr:hypothetical protein TNCV_4983581 [Trichonephila clavipes]
MTDRTAVSKDFEQELGDLVHNNLCQLTYHSTSFVAEKKLNRLFYAYNITPFISTRALLKYCRILSPDIMLKAIIGKQHLRLLLAKRRREFEMYEGTALPQESEEADRLEQSKRDIGVLPSSITNKLFCSIKTV